MEYEEEEERKKGALIQMWVWREKWWLWMVSASWVERDDWMLIMPSTTPLPQWHWKTCCLCLYFCLGSHSHLSLTPCPTHIHIPLSSLSFSFFFFLIFSLKDNYKLWNVFITFFPCMKNIIIIWPILIKMNFDRLNLRFLESTCSKIWIIKITWSKIGTKLKVHRLKWYFNILIICVITIFTIS